MEMMYFKWMFLEVKMSIDVVVELFIVAISIACLLYCEVGCMQL
jgi:hypothetical protein